MAGGAEMKLMVNGTWIGADDRVDLCPPDLKSEIDGLNARITKSLGGWRLNGGGSSDPRGIRHGYGAAVRRPR